MIAVTLLHNAPVYLLTPGVVTDSYGDPIESWDTPERVRLPGAAVEAPGASGSSTSEVETPTLDTLHNSRVLHVPRRLALTSRHRIEAEGSQWHVVGEPLVRVGALSTFTRVALRRVVRVGADG
jgi:hypothetical protein